MGEAMKIADEAKRWLESTKNMAGHQACYLPMGAVREWARRVIVLNDIDCLLARHVQRPPNQPLPAALLLDRTAKARQLAAVRLHEIANEDLYHRDREFLIDMARSLEENQ